MLRRWQEVALLVRPGPALSPFVLLLSSLWIRAYHWLFFLFSLTFCWCFCFVFNFCEYCNFMVCNKKGRFKNGKRWRAFLPILPGIFKGKPTQQTDCIHPPPSPPFMSRGDWSVSSSILSFSRPFHPYIVFVSHFVGTFRGRETILRRPFSSGNGRVCATRRRISVRYIRW